MMQEASQYLVRRMETTHAAEYRKTMKIAARRSATPALTAALSLLPRMAHAESWSKSDRPLEQTGSKNAIFPNPLSRGRGFEYAAGLSLAGSGFFPADCTADLNIGARSPV